MIKYVLLAAAVAAFMAFAGPASAQGEHGASVVNDGGCVILGTDWAPGGDPLSDALISEDSIRVISDSGVRTVQCIARMPAGTLPPRSAVIKEGFPCSIAGELTYDSRTVSTPGGKVLFVCHLFETQ